MNNDKSRESIQPVAYILCKKKNGVILKRIIIKDLGDSIYLVNELIIFNNKLTPPSNIYVADDLVFLSFC